MKQVKPEKVGIESANILQLIKRLEDSGLNMHSLIISRYGKICCEAYWKPFDKDFAHRIYSVTKSFVGIAIGFLIQDGLLSIEDRILQYFPEMEKHLKNKELKNQTIYDMLVMATASNGYNWFLHKTDDRVRDYFETVPEIPKTPGTLFNYDSNGSFVLCALVEKISGKEFLEYLREKLFDKIGMSQNIQCLKCPGGHSWGDSALIMPARDLLKFAAFLMNKGNHNGEQILNEKFVLEATSKQIDNSPNGTNSFSEQGYGYQIWRGYDNSFALLGMGNQDVICVPDKDLIFLCNSDNQGIGFARKLIADSFFELIARKASKEELPENQRDYEELNSYTQNLSLSVARGEKSSDYAAVINGKTFELENNPMGIKNIRLDFNGNFGSLSFTNQQGDKEIKFGMGENVFGVFPQTGYSKEYGSVAQEGHMYKCAASAGWTEKRKLYIKVQIIDKYFGNLNITIGFNKDGRLGMCMHKFAEDFLNEYNGFAIEKQ